MFGVRSLRFRLPAIFLLGVVLAGLVTSVVAIRLFQDYSEKQTVRELRRQAQALAAIYVAQAGNLENAPEFAASKLEEATDAQLFYVGSNIFPGQITGLQQLSPEERAAIGFGQLPRQTRTIEFVPPASDQTYLAIAEPIEAGGEVFGALIVAKPKDELADPVAALVWRVGLACLGGLLVAAGLFLYLSRRLTKPVLALSEAVDEVAGGRYDVDVPRLHSGDEIAHLADRFRDMTERLAAASALERNFLMTVSHELRTPLTAIRGHVDALREGLVEDAEARDASLEVIRTETDRLARLVGDLLDLAKLEANRFALVEEEVDLERLLEQAYQGFAEEARRREITYARDIEDAPLVLSDGDRVLQVVSNLLENAFEWTPDGGTIRLGLEHRPGGRVALSVSDSGPGIPLEEQERIFRPFWSKNGQGTGLGLAIARELAQALGGRLELDTAVGRGSRFALVLPTAGVPTPELALRAPL
jgi:signal transduction histidine kinase